MRKFLLNFVFLSYRKNFVGTQKLVRISHGKRAIRVRLYVNVQCFFVFFFVYVCVEVLLPMSSASCLPNHTYTGQA